MSEVRWDSFGERATQIGCIFLYSRYNADEGLVRRDGVGLLLSKTAKRNLTAGHPISERILRESFKGNAIMPQLQEHKLTKNRHFIRNYLELSRTVIRRTEKL
jgi:hypothetical protein